MTADESTPGDVGESSVELTVLRGSPTPAELAAVTAVITAMVEQLDGDSRLSSGGSGWDRSQRQLRSPLYPGRGAWSAFTG